MRDSSKLWQRHLRDIDRRSLKHLRLLVFFLLQSVSDWFTIFSRSLTEQGVAPYAVAFYRYIVAAIPLLPVLILHRKAWREITWGLSAGAMIGLGWIG